VRIGSFQQNDIDPNSKLMWEEGFRTGKLAKCPVYLKYV